MCASLREILSEVTKTSNYLVHCVVLKITREEMLHGGALLCNISSWCDGVIDHEYLSGCDVYSTRDVVLNCLFAIVLLNASFA
jgi:hypothetical protein